MNVRYRLLQFLVDPYREEGRNIGLIAHIGKKVYVRALGVDEDGQADPVIFERLLDDSTKHDAWVYREWANWWRDLVNSDGGPARVDEALDRVNLRSISMNVTDGGIMEMEDSKDPRQAIDWLYRRVMRAEDLFHEQLRRLLVDTSIEKLGGYQADFFVEFPVETGPKRRGVRIHLDFVAGREHPLGFKCVRFRDVEPRELAMAINDAVYSFNLAVRHRYLQRDHCVVLTDTPDDQQREHYHDSVLENARVIDIFSPNASREISQLLDNQFAG